MLTPIGVCLTILQPLLEGLEDAIWTLWAYDHQSNTDLLMNLINSATRFVLLT